MARVFVTGSADGLGLMAGRLLLDAGHDVTLHARSDSRADEVRRAQPRAKAVLVGELARIADVRSLAAQANESGRFDAVIHNAGIGYREPRRVETVDGLEHVFAINVLAPYLLTALMTRPDRLVYLSSGMHQGGSANLDDPQWAARRWNGAQAYSDSKLYDVVLAFAIAQRWPDVRSNAVDPGWVATKMGGAGAPGDLSQGPVTQAWLATSDDPAATVTAGYFYHRRQRTPLAAAERAGLQDGLLDYCARLSGTAFPAA
jgi:NAD(P)-dependent dehydrogenase (short-subunit alcohol dehydrogenase family)